MASRVQKVRLGLFFLISISVLVVFLVVVTGVQVLKPRDHYFIEFDFSVGGLTKGNQVKYLGNKVGRVENTTIDEEDIGTVVVEISLDRSKVTNLIRTDTRAELQSQGVVGFKHIELFAGSQDAEILPPGSRIPSSSTRMANLGESAQLLAEKLQRLVDNATHLTRRENSKRLGLALDQGGQLMRRSNDIIEDNRESIDAVFENMASTTGSLASTAKHLEATMDSLHQIVADGHMRGTIENLHLAARSAREHLEGPVPDLLAHMTRATGNLDTTVTHVDRVVLKGRKDFLDAMASLQETLENIRQATEIIRENPSVLIRGTDKE